MSIDGSAWAGTSHPISSSLNDCLECLLTCIRVVCCLWKSK